MKPQLLCSALAAASATVLLGAALPGCASSQDARLEQQRAANTGKQASGRMTAGVPGGRMAMMDMMAMCDMHQKMVSPKTPEEQQASVNEHMKNVSPEKREKNLSLMREKCK
jgi:hypothetical protein